MKIAAVLAFAAGASAFAPSSQPAARSSALKAAELDGMLGTSIETGNKIVSWTL
jgi:hypothetical protein